METKHIDYGKVRPTIDDNWSIDNSYELLTFIKNGSKLYISKKDVPTGIELTNEDYWDLLIDGGDVSEKENKSNKKNNLNYTNENFYPTVVAVKNAIDALHIENKLKYYEFYSSKLYIKQTSNACSYLVQAIDGDNADLKALYYIDGSMSAYCITDTLGVNNINMCHSTDDENDLYVEVDFVKQGREICVTVIPLPNNPITIYENLENIVVDEVFDIYRLVEPFVLTLEPDGGDGAITDMETFESIVSNYKKGNRVQIYRTGRPTRVEDVIAIDESLNKAYTLDWMITVRSS